MKRNLQIALLLGAWAIATHAWADIVSDVTLSSVQVGATLSSASLSNTAVVFVDVVNQAPTDTYTFDLLKSDAAAGAMYNGLLSSLATGNPVTLDYTQSCGCDGSCLRTINAITFE